MTKPTMQDIADRAGVSRSAVSRALRDHPSIPQQTRERIKQIAIDMGYTQNPMITALMSNLRSTRSIDNAPAIAYVITQQPPVDWKMNRMLREVFSGAQTRAAELGFRLVEFPGSLAEWNYRRLSSILHARGISGVLFGPIPHDGLQSMDFDWNRFSSVTLGALLPGVSVPVVRHNHFEGMKVVFEKVLEKGYRRIGFVIVDSVDQLNRHRWSASYLSCQLNHLRSSERVPILIVPLESSSKEKYEIACKWQQKHRVDAVIAPWYSPHCDVANGKIATLSYNAEEYPDVSGIHQYPEKIGVVGMELLASKLYHNEKGCSSPMQEVLLSGEWIEGSTL